MEQVGCVDVLGPVRVAFNLPFVQPLRFDAAFSKYVGMEAGHHWSPFSLLVLNVASTQFGKSCVPFPLSVH
jgi:hypothetical protein